MNYEIGHIYKIICNLDNSFCYIGSTFKRLDKRWKTHIDDYKYKYGKISIHPYFNKYGIENFKIKLIKSYKVVRVDKKDHKHLYAYETLHINRNKKTCVNTYLPFTPMKYLNRKEWRENNKDKIKEYNKEYDKKKYQKNKEIIKEKAKEYYQNNKAIINKKAKEKNKDKLNEKINCQCGGKYIKQNISRHLKTKKHIKFIKYATMQ
jgi:hypothetical protein